MERPAYRWPEHSPAYSELRRWLADRGDRELTPDERWRLRAYVARTAGDYAGRAGQRFEGLCGLIDDLQPILAMVVVVARSSSDGDDINDALDAIRVRAEQARGDLEAAARAGLVADLANELRGVAAMLEELARIEDGLVSLIRAAALQSESTSEWGRERRSHAAPKDMRAALLAREPVPPALRIVHDAALPEPMHSNVHDLVGELETAYAELRDAP